MARSLFGNSNRKLKSTFWGNPFIPVGTNQTECCVPFTNLSVPSRFQTHAPQIPPFLDSNRNGCGNSAVSWSIDYHYAFDTSTVFFWQMVAPQVSSLLRMNRQSTGRWRHDLHAKTWLRIWNVIVLDIWTWLESELWNYWAVKDRYYGVVKVYLLLKTFFVYFR